MNTSPSRLILTTEGFAPREDLHEVATEKVAKILRHETTRVHLVRVHVKLEKPNHSPANFAVRATAEHAGRDHVVHADGTEPLVSINNAFAKLERALTAAAGVRKHARHAGDVAA